MPGGELEGSDVGDQEVVGGSAGGDLGDEAGDDVVAGAGPVEHLAACPVGVDVTFLGLLELVDGQGLSGPRQERVEDGRGAGIPNVGRRAGGESSARGVGMSPGRMGWAWCLPRL